MPDLLTNQKIKQIKSEIRNLKSTIKQNEEDDWYLSMHPLGNLKYEERLKKFRKKLKLLENSFNKTKSSKIKPVTISITSIPKYLKSKNKTQRIMASEKLLSLVQKKPKSLEKIMSQLLRLIRESDYDVSEEENLNVAKSLIIFFLIDKDYEDEYRRFTQLIEFLEYCQCNDLIQILKNQKYKMQLQKILSYLSSDINSGSYNSKKQAVLLLCTFGFEGIDTSQTAPALKNLLSKIPPEDKYLGKFVESALARIVVKK